MTEATSRPVGDVSVVRYIFFRMVLFAGLFGTVALFVLVEPWTLLTRESFFDLAAVFFLVMAISAVGIPRYGHTQWFRWSQLLFDTVLVTTLIFITDGPSSPFFVLYFMNIVAAAWLLRSWGAIAVAAIDAFALGVTAAAGVFGYVEWDVVMNGTLMYTRLTLHVMSFFLVGMLAGFLSQVAAKTRTELAWLRAEHHMVLNQLDTGILLTDNVGTIQVLNPAGQALLGSVIGEAIKTVLQPRGLVWEQDFVSNGIHRVLVCRKQQMDSGGDVIVVEDITDLRQMEERVEREERLAAVGRLAAGLAHEIRNPLASLSGAVQLLQEESEDELHGIVLREVENLNELVDDFLDIARPLQLRVARVPVSTIVEDVVAAFEQDRRYQGKCTMQTEIQEVPVLAIDGNRVRQVLWNLVLNAAQATSESGEISITVQPYEAGLDLLVQDQGVGIPVSQMERIFDPFYTTRSGGTGLGLANVDRIVRAHGGEVLVYSKEGEGTTFTLRFPCDAESASLEPLVEM